MPAMEALETMGREYVNQLPVMSNGQIEGIVSRAQVLQVLRSRAELKFPQVCLGPPEKKLFWDRQLRDGIRATRRSPEKSVGVCRSSAQHSAILKVLKYVYRRRPAFAATCRTQDVIQAVGRLSASKYRQLLRI